MWVDMERLIEIRNLYDLSSNFSYYPPHDHVSIKVKVQIESKIPLKGEI